MVLENVCSVIKQIKGNSLKSVKKEPVWIKNLNEVIKIDNVVYYGIITVGENTNLVINNGDNDIVPPLEQNQIIELFESFTSILDNEGELQLLPKGHFRGWKITVV